MALAHAQGRKVKLSIGGWTGSRFFSRGVRTAPARSSFAKAILHAYKNFDLDGIDIDWEYPNGDGAGNEKSPKDAANFLKFLKLLRKMLPPNATITAAVALAPFTGPDGQPLSDVREFADVLDWVLLMNYDVWGCESFHFDERFATLTLIAMLAILPRLNSSLVITWTKCTLVRWVRRVTAAVR